MPQGLSLRRCAKTCLLLEHLVDRRVYRRHRMSRAALDETSPPNHMSDAHKPAPVTEGRAPKLAHGKRTWRLSATF